MDTFTLITGIAGLLGLFLQLKDAFPEHRDVRKAIVLLTIGVFVGSLIASLLKAQITFTVPISSFGILAGAFGVVLAIMAISAAMSSDPHKRSDLLEATGGGLLVFLIVLFFGSLIMTSESHSDRSMKEITIEEFVALSDVQVKHGNYERAIHFLEQAKASLPKSDPRYESLQKYIAEIKAKPLIRQ